MKLQIESLESRQMMTRCIDIEGTPSAVGDYNADGLTTVEDFYEATDAYAVGCAKPNWFRATQAMGDANLDGVFNSDDLIQILASGKYGRGSSPTANWYEGDFDFDGRFDPGDLLHAFSYGQYETQLPKAELMRQRDRLRTEVFEGSKDLDDLKAFYAAHDLIWGDEDMNGFVDHETYMPTNDGDLHPRTLWSKYYNGHIVSTGYGWFAGDVNASGYADVGDLQLVYGDDVDPDTFHDDFYWEYVSSR